MWGEKNTVQEVCDGSYAERSLLLFQQQRESVYHEDDITYDTRPKCFGLICTEEENGQVDNDTRAAVPNPNIFGSATFLKPLIGTMGS